MANMSVPTGAYDITFQKALNSVGVGSFKIEEQTFNNYYNASTPPTFGDVFEISLYGTVVFSFEWEEKSRRYNGDYIEITISGRGAICALKKVGIWADPSKMKMDTSTDPYTFTYGGKTYDIPTNSGVQGVYIRSEVDPRMDLGTTVGGILQTLKNEAVDRGAVLPVINGLGSTDANGVTWETFSDFKVRIGKDLLGAIEDLAKKGLCIYRQSGNSLNLYSPSGTFNSVDLSTYSNQIVSIDEHENYRDQTNHALIVDSEVVTSYRPSTGTTSTEKGVSIEVSNNPNIHARVGESETNTFKSSINLDMATNSNGINPFINFDVGDTLTFDNTVFSFSRKALSMTLKINNDTDSHICMIELGNYNMPVKSTDTDNSEEIKDVSHRASGGVGGTSSEETLEYAKSLYDSAGVAFNFSKPYTNLLSANAEIVTSDASLLDSSDFILVCVPITDTNGQYTGVKVYPKGSSIPANNTALEISLNAIVS